MSDEFEEHEMYGKCVVCCKELDWTISTPDYCEDHQIDLSVPPIPLAEWFKVDWELEDEDERYATA